MFVVYGVERSRIVLENIFYKCSFCGSYDHVQLMVSQKYFYLYGVPCFPMGKEGTIQCLKCKYKIDEKSFSAEDKSQYILIKKNARTPLWTFSGLVIVVGLICCLIVLIRQGNKENTLLIASPRVGDIYEVKHSFHSYTLYKVQEIVEDTVYVRVHKQFTDKISGIHSLKTQGDEYYLNETIPFLKSELKRQYESGLIIAIDRFKE